MTDETPHNPYQAPDSTIQSQAKPDTPELASRLYRLLGALIDGLVQLLVINDSLLLGVITHLNLTF